MGTIPPLPPPPKKRYTTPTPKDIYFKRAFPLHKSVSLARYDSPDVYSPFSQHRLARGFGSGGWRPWEVGGIRRHQCGIGLILIRFQMSKACEDDATLLLADRIGARGPAQASSTASSAVSAVGLFAFLPFLFIFFYSRVCLFTYLLTSMVSVCYQ